MNNLSEKLKDLVKQDTMKYYYGGKKTIFAKTGIKQLDIEETKRKHAIALKQVMESDITKNYLKSVGLNEAALTIHTLNAHIINQLLESVKYTKAIVFN